MFILIIATLSGGSMTGWSVQRVEGFTTQASCELAGQKVAALAGPRPYYPIQFTCVSRNN